MGFLWRFRSERRSGEEKGGGEKAMSYTGNPKVKVACGGG
jgi:hypothetical protein